MNLWVERPWASVESSISVHLCYDRGRMTRPDATLSLRGRHSEDML